MEENIVFVRLSNNFARDPFPSENRPPLDLIQTQEILKTKHKLGSKLIDGQINLFTIPELTKKCLSLKPKIIALSCISPKINECKEFFSLIKQFDPEIICIVVGHLATYCTRKICNPDSDVDFIIRGEFQFVLANFLIQTQGLNLKSIRAPEDKIYCKQSKDLSDLHIIEDADTLPIIPLKKNILTKYKNIIPLPVAKHIVWGRLFSSYGCPNNCIFCTQAIRDTYGRNYRTRIVANIIKELNYLKSAGANIIEFCDDNFTASKVHLHSLCHSMIKNKIDIPWGAHARIDDIDYETLCLMKKAGCLFIRSGIESGSERVLKSLNKTNSAGTWQQKSREIFSWCKKLRIMTVANFMLGNPGETASDIRKTKELILALDPDVLQLHTFCAYPGSEAFDKQKDKYSELNLVKMHHHNSFQPYNNSVDIIKAQKDILRSFYLRAPYLAKHFMRFGAYYLLNPEKATPILKSFCAMIINSY